VQFNDANRAYFAGMAKIQAAKGRSDMAGAMKAFLRDPSDEPSIALVAAKDPSWNATLRTTCVATMLHAGHGTNALPQRARANINCRIFPGVSAEAVRAKLEGWMRTTLERSDSPIYYNCHEGQRDLVDSGACE
jgi:acetylornithine deacetylase/succinyl-diaminopimelate desuccinylase-like protein